MKTTKFKFALLFTAMTFSAYVSGQQDEITNGITANSSLNELKVKIYQNPANPGNIKNSLESQHKNRSDTNAFKVQR